MRGSIVIAAHNEGRPLVRTVASVQDIAALLDLEIVVVDDASTDGSVDEMLAIAPEVRVVRHETRRGTAPAKDSGARSAHGDALIFLDGHTKPENGAVLRLLERVEELEGEAIVVPRVVVLDPVRWKNDPRRAGYGFRLILPALDGTWLRPDALRRQGRFYESPTLCGCCFAISKALYEKLAGFDPDMIQWGPEDIDLGLKSWLLGHPILNDSLATIGHRFTRQFAYEVAPESVIANKIRIARKNFSEGVFRIWLRDFGACVEDGEWERALELFEGRRSTAEAEREHLERHRVHDERWFAARFGCGWPT